MEAADLFKHAAQYPWQLLLNLQLPHYALAYQVNTYSRFFLSFLLTLALADAQQNKHADATTKDEEMQDVSTQGEKPTSDTNQDQMVEYQCDSCHTIILDQRWHCDECADFDLCDKCTIFISFTN